ncbi:MAG TPA: serine hydrolase [Candidatus Saccharimonadales bacterium]|nr:serine hydrolase [Candidatus Saccharimonadales bacterium]
MQKPKQKQFSLKFLALGFAILATCGLGYAHFHAATLASAKLVSSTQHADAGLQQVISRWVASQPSGASVMVRELDGQARYAGSNAGISMVTASTYKLYIAYAVLHDIEANRFTMMTKLPGGQTVKDALKQMITVSDNDAGKALGTLVGWQHADQLAAEVGANHTDLDNYSATGVVDEDKRTTASDLTDLLDQLQAGKLLSPLHTQLVLNLMKKQVWRERVPAGVPDGVAVADKPGWLPGTQNDAAIVYGPKSTYALVIMTNGDTTKPLANLSERVYDYLEQ